MLPRALPPGRRRVRVAVVLALLLGGAWLVVRAPRRRVPPNLVLIVVDTLRADRTSLCGGPRPTTPALEDWARGGTVFEAARAASSWTLPSMAALFSGRYRPAGAAPLASDAEVLAERLAARGYRTGAVVANPILQPSYGFDRGFGDYRLAPIPEPGGPLEEWLAPRAVDEALAWLDGGDDDGPFFLYLHLNDPHAPYKPLEGLAFEPEPAPRRRAQAAAFAAETGTPLPPGALGRAERIDALYDSEVLQVDRALARLLAELERRGLARDTLVVFTADHGEGLADRPGAGWANPDVLASGPLPGFYTGHGAQLSGEQVRVPLALRGPGVPAGARRADPVSLVDVLPTVLALLDVAPPPGVDGVALFEAPPAPAARAHFLYCNRGHALLVGGRWKLLAPDAQRRAQTAEDGAEARARHARILEATGYAGLLDDDGAPADGAPADGR